MKASRSGRVLDNKDAPFVKGMINRGDRQHDIAAYFGVNGGRIGETSTGDQFAGISAAAISDLPPAAPYLVVPASLRGKAKNILSALKSSGADSTLIRDAELILDAFEASHKSRRGV